MKTLREFCEKSHVPAPLIRAVVRQSGGWDEWDQTARDVTKGGADAGFHGFIYYTDTLAFARRNIRALIELAKQQADDMGEEPLAMIAGFNCLRSHKLPATAVAEAIYRPNGRTIQDRNAGDDRTLVLNALAWYALEEVARSYCDLIDAS